jgi:hypothetical protein
MEINHNDYGKEDIDNFIKAVLLINPYLEPETTKLLLICHSLELEHPNVKIEIYKKHHEDLYCKGYEINNMFVTTLDKVGYNTNDKMEGTFTDVSIE